MDEPIKVAGDDSFSLGMNGFIQSTRLGPGQYECGMNIISRGGLAQTRPGSASLLSGLTLPAGRVQGMTFFTPTDGAACLVFAIAGKVYVSKSPFKTYTRVGTLQFSAYSPYISWTSCLQSTYYTVDGELQFLARPKAVLVMQDGNTRAAFWDGSISRHLNPTKSGQTITREGYDETLIGLWSCWSGNRLWVSRGNQVFASDIGNPLKFTETQYLNEGRAFYLPGQCTGIAETTDRQGIICFTANSGTFLRSSIQDRTQWLQTPLFQETALPNVGCVAPRSIINQYGLLWWMTPKGIVNQDDALTQNISSRLTVHDNEMIQSKANLSYDLSNVCGTFFESFMLQAVPNGDKINTRVHVLDQAPFQEMPYAWPSYWTGWRPVEFARGIVKGQERVFCISQDYDGETRIWELFTSDKTDNGIPITSFVVTKTHLFDTRDFKRFRYAEIEVGNLLGPTAMMVAVAGIKGGFQSVMVKDMVATDGQLYYDTEYGFESNELAGSRPQTRIVKTEDSATPSSCNEECIESNERGLIDKGFSLLIAWSGIMGVSCYRVFGTNEQRPYKGVCETNETGETRLLTASGCSTTDPVTDSQPLTEYTESATFSRIDPDTGDEVSATCTQSSMISSEDATRKATAMAEWYVMSQIGEI